ncbi:MAG: 30S ribosomal protein S24e [Candidatus Diapherotrites archaeon]|nr:30S ribosomal protein S24e [Candidatus Diapherotrites archaeon]
MKLKIVERKKNPLLYREDIIAEVEAETTPSRKELREKLAATLASKAELVIIKKIKQEFGQHKATVLAKHYESQDLLEKIEPKYIINRNLGIKETKKGKKKEEVKEQEDSLKGAEGKETKEEKQGKKEKEEEKGEEKNE